MPPLDSLHLGSLHIQILKLILIHRQQLAVKHWHNLVAKKVLFIQFFITHNEIKKDCLVFFSDSLIILKVII